MADNIAVLDGYTVKLEGRQRLPRKRGRTEQVYVYVNGWTWTFSPVTAV